MSTDPAATAADMRSGRYVLPLAYAALFVVLLPVLLGLWMHRLDQVFHLPLWGSPATGLALAGSGALLMVTATLALWMFGHGLPMSPFPPERLVVRGVYRVVSHPMYLGAVFVCAGLALLARSPAGFWIVSPVLAAAATAFVLGYEADATRHRFGRIPAPLLSLPPAADSRPSSWNRCAVCVLVFLPWFFLFGAVGQLGAPMEARSTYMAWETRLPVLPWTEAFYGATYVYVLLATLLAGRQRDLRRFAIRGLGATAAIIAFYLLVPLVAIARPVPADGSAWAMLMRAQRYLSPYATAALPAFPVVWTCLASEVYIARWPRARLLVIALTAAIAVSCVTAGMHSILDVVAALAAYALIRHAGVLWRHLCRGTEAIANSWREWQVGPVRFLSHGLFAAVGAALGVGVAVWLAGSGEIWWILAMTFGAWICAGAWAQLLEGSPQLLRPYGYFGGALGIAGVGVAAALVGHDAWLDVAAMATGGCFTQAMGRLRCLIQGCCHGRPVDAPWGIRFTHPRSRVLRLGHLGGVALHPTQLYSILSTCVSGLALLRLWMLAVPLPFIAGSYLILIGLGRFVEEHYRGEPQTACIGGLRLYQWLAIAFLVAGAALTTVDGPRAVVPASFDLRVLPLLVLLAFILYPAFGIDLPGSNRRFSRLA